MLKNRILDKIDVVWREMKDLQPKNAKIAQNEDALKDTLTRYGFSVPFYGWKDKDGAIWVIDGHTRKKVLSTFGAVPEKLPCILIDAKSKKEAQEILIEVFNQKHNPFDVQVLEQFINENELKVKVENVNIENTTSYIDECENEKESEDKEEKYTKNIEAPIYLPKNEKPKISELCSLNRFNAIISKIDNSDGVDEDEKEFLRLAATRHIVFNYSRIADYYSNSEKELQELFEDNALVIIDFDKAIEQGFVKLSEELLNMYADEKK